MTTVKHPTTENALKVEPVDTSSLAQNYDEHPEAVPRLAQVYELILECGTATGQGEVETAGPSETPDYETAWIESGHVFMVVEKKRLGSEALTGFLAANGFELSGRENGFLLYSSCPRETLPVWEAARAFLATPAEDGQETKASETPATPPT